MWVKRVLISLCCSLWLSTSLPFVLSGACLESLCFDSRTAGSFLGNICFSRELFASWGFIACSEFEFSQTNFSSVSRLGFNQMESFMVEGGSCMIFRG